MITHSPEETRAAGREFAQQLRLGDIVLLEGQLGSGKTVFVQGIAEGLGASEPATSPSFVLVNEYALPSEQGTVSSEQQPVTVHSPPPTAHLLRHLDLYRLADPAEDLERIGLSELLHDPQAITVIEWADRLPKDMIPPAVRVISVRVAHGGSEDERMIEIR